MGYAAEIARCQVVAERGRLLVSWRSDYAWAFLEIKNSFRASFPRHGDACYLPAERAWSLPLHARPRLDLWLSLTFQPAAVAWHTADREAGATDEPAAVPSGDPLSAAYRALWLHEGAPLWAAEAVYRAAQKHAHPDSTTGSGSHEAAAALNRAIALIRERHEARRRGAA